jgi:protocatechuate 3,4-dioxygenase beta subunit
MHPTPADPHPESPPRRRLLRASASLALVGIAGPALAVSTPLPPTPRNAEGPFYPRQKPADSDADLTRVAGRAGRAKGTILYVSGRVLDVRGTPIGAAELELWQANAFRRYHHPSDSDASGPLDPDFQGYGKLATDAAGQFRIKTIKPPPYSGRTPHIHFNVAGGGTRLTTQMFFEGEAMNERDGLYRYLSRDDRRASTGRFVDRATAAEPDSVAVVWDIVLAA